MKLELLIFASVALAGMCAEPAVKPSTTDIRHSIFKNVKQDPKVTGVLEVLRLLMPYVIQYQPADPTKLEELRKAYREESAEMESKKSVESWRDSNPIHTSVFIPAFYLHIFEYYA